MAQAPFAKSQAVLTIKVSARGREGASAKLTPHLCNFTQNAKERYLWQPNYVL